MRNELIDIYTYNELSDEAKQNVLSKFNDINVDHEWYKPIYEDAESVGLCINDFDLHNTISVKLVRDFNNVLESILTNHGPNTPTYKIAQAYKNEYYTDDSISNFLGDIGSEYLTILEDNYEYLTSQEAIEEALISNEYEFTESGILYY